MLRLRRSPLVEARQSPSRASQETASPKPMSYMDNLPTDLRAHWGPDEQGGRRSSHLHRDAGSSRGPEGCPQGYAHEGWAAAAFSPPGRPLRHQLKALKAAIADEAVNTVAVAKIDERMTSSQHEPEEEGQTIRPGHDVADHPAPRQSDPPRVTAPLCRPARLPSSSP